MSEMNKSATRGLREQFSVTDDSEAELMKDNLLRAAIVVGAAVTAGPAVAVGAAGYFATKAVSEIIAFNTRRNTPVEVEAQVIETP
jgi:hypothetical protein